MLCNFRMDTFPLSKRFYETDAKVIESNRKQGFGYLVLLLPSNFFFASTEDFEKSETLLYHKELCRKTCPWSSFYIF